MKLAAEKEMFEKTEGNCKGIEGRIAEVSKFRIELVR
jgi:hypothetical protein